MNASMNPPFFVNVATAPHTPETPERTSVRYDDFVRVLLKPDSIKLQILHAALGIAGELCELDEPFQRWAELNPKQDEEVFGHVIEELGDYEFYLQAIHNHYGTTVIDAMNYAEGCYSAAGLNGSYSKFMAHTGKLVDEVKREYIYGKERNLKNVLNLLGCLYLCLEHFYTYLGTTRQHVLQCNAMKLETRYAGLVYSDAAAIARADKKPGE